MFDEDTTSMILYSLALLRFKEYVGESEDLVKYLCALSLERMIIQTGRKFPKFQNENPRNLRMSDIIRFLEQKSHISSAKAKQLREYMDFRDSIIHTSLPVGTVEVDVKVHEILSFLCVEAGMDFDEELRNRTFEDIATLGKRRSANIMDYEELVESDFDNLDRLYEKCPALQREIEKRLRTPLVREQISGFTPNTGGIWLPFVTQGAPLKRAHVYGASVGVTFTPVDIRFGLDFGSQAHKYRIKYYELLLNGELEKEFDVLNRKDTGYCICDTFWYYHIRNVRSLEWCFSLYSDKKKDIERAIEETRQLDGKALTAHRFLIGRVIKRRPEDFPSIIDRIVEESSKTLDELYPIILRIQAN